MKKLGAYAGLDLSLAGTAAVMLDSEGKVVSVLAYSTSKKEVLKAAESGNKIMLSPAVLHGDGRSMWRRTAKVSTAIREWVQEHAEPGCFFGIEDHAFGARGTSVYQLGHLHGLVRRDLQDADKHWILIAPTELKAAVTGTGAAKKEDMMRMPSAHLNQETFGASTRNNVVDAYWLARLAKAFAEYHRDKALPDGLPDTFLNVLLPHGKKKGMLRKQVLP